MKLQAENHNPLSNEDSKKNTHPITDLRENTGDINQTQEEQQRLLPVKNLVSGTETKIPAETNHQDTP